MVSIQKKYIGLLGGSFDPAHKGHLGISKIAIQKFKLKKIYWVITKKNPLKKNPLFSLKRNASAGKYPHGKICFNIFCQKWFLPKFATCLRHVYDTLLLFCDNIKDAYAQQCPPHMVWNLICFEEY